MFSYGPPHMAEQKQDDQLKHTYSRYVRIRDVALKTCQRRWTIGRSGERGSGISMPEARHDDDVDYSVLHFLGSRFVIFCCLSIFIFKWNIANHYSYQFWIVFVITFTYIKQSEYSVFFFFHISSYPTPSAGSVHRQLQDLRLIKHRNMSYHVYRVLSESNTGSCSS